MNALLRRDPKSEKKIKKKMEEEATWDGEALILLNCGLQVWTTKLHSRAWAFG